MADAFTMAESRNVQEWYKASCWKKEEKKQEQKKARQGWAGREEAEKRREIKGAKEVCLSLSTSRNMSIPDGSPDLTQTPKLRKLFKFPNAQLSAIMLLL